MSDLSSPKLACLTGFRTPRPPVRACQVFRIEVHECLAGVDRLVFAALRVVSHSEK